MKYINSAYNARCPVCSNTQNKLLYKVTSKEAATHFLVTHNVDKGKLREIDDKIVDLWGGKSASVVACTNCGFTFADPFVSGDYEFYNLLPHSMGTSDENWKWEFDKTYQKITNIASVTSDLQFLEIGSSTGDFVKRIAKLIASKNIFCLEYSQIGIDNIRKAGIEAHSWNFLDLKTKEGFEKKFDIICLFQVLEHLDKLEETFSTFNTIARPNAHLFIGVPNGKKIKFNELNNALLDMPPNHIGRYTDKTFEFLGNKYNWEIEEIANEYFTPLDVMSTVMYYQSLKRAQLPPIEETAWFRAKQYIEIKYLRLLATLKHKELGDTLWVHYRKAA